MQPADEPAVAMSYADDIGYETGQTTGQSSHVLGAAANDGGGEIFSDNEDEVLQQQQMDAEDVDGDANDSNSFDSDEEDEEEDQEEATIPKEWNQPDPYETGRSGYVQQPEYDYLSQQ
jgi:hypothetical protein